MNFWGDLFGILEMQGNPVMTFRDEPRQTGYKPREAAKLARIGSR